MNTEVLLRKLKHVIEDPRLLVIRGLTLSGLSLPIRGSHPDGYPIRAILPDPIGKNLWSRSIFEPEVGIFLRYVTKKGMQVLDIGTHIGYHALTAATLVGEEGKVICFEPTPRTFQILRNNCSGHKNVVLYPYALGDRTGNANLYDYGPNLAAYNCIGESRMPDGLRHHQQVLIVPIFTLDDFCSKNPWIHPNVLKIDAENSENAILQKGRQTIDFFKPAIILEGGDMGRNTDNSTRICLDLLQGLGYTVHFYDPQLESLRPHQLQDSYPNYCNLLCIHPSNSPTSPIR